MTTPPGPSAQIDGASFIVESTLEGSQAVQPSQGAHFFQNIMSFGLGYMTVDTGKGESSGAVDYDWMKAMPAVRSPADTPRQRSAPSPSPD